MKPPASDTDKTSKIVALHLAAERFVDSMSTAGRTSILPFSSTVGKRARLSTRSRRSP